jgi:protein-S-isoprenylcysteine O-methyltransferase Ste14
MLIGRFLSRTKRKKTDLKEQLQGILRDPTAIMLVFTTLTSFTLPVVEAVFRQTIKFNILSFSNGFLFIGLGWVLSYFANQDIAENWSPEIVKYDDQFLITSGTYQVVRHPLYLAGLLIFVGTQIYLQNTWSWILLLLMVPTIMIRISLEEKRLIKKFGRKYQEYKQRTKALFPLIW